MTFIKIQDPITIEAESGEIFKVYPAANGCAYIEIVQIPEEEMPTDEEYAEKMEQQQRVEDWKKEDGFAQPEYVRKKDWIPEDEEEDPDDSYNIAHNLKSKPQITNDMCSWPLP